MLSRPMGTQNLFFRPAPVASGGSSVKVTTLFRETCTRTAVTWCNPAGKIPENDVADVQ